jgi:hypothetical protein
MLKLARVKDGILWGKILQEHYFKDQEQDFRNKNINLYIGDF